MYMTPFKRPLNERDDDIVIGFVYLFFHARIFKNETLHLSLALIIQSMVHFPNLPLPKTVTDELS